MADPSNLYGIPSVERASERPSTSRKRPKTPASRPLSPVDDDVEVQTYGNGSRKVTPPSLASPFDSTYSPRRSISLQAVGLGTYPKRNRARSGSGAALQDVQSPPKRGHRLSRSISSNATPVLSHSGQDDDEEQDSLGRGGVASASTEAPLQHTNSRTARTPLRILSTSFGKAAEEKRPSTSRRASDAHLGLAQTMSNLSGTANGYSPVGTYNHIVETTNKRMATLEYLRKVHEGQVYYFSTISYNPNGLSTLPSLHPTKLGRRATNYLLLGSSLTPVLEFYASNPLDYLRVLAALLSEYDAYTQLSSSESGGMSLTRNRMGQMFKSGIGIRGAKNRRTSTADHSLGDQMSMINGSTTNLSGVSSLADSLPLPPVHNTSGHDFQYLQLPSLPFDPDFFTSFATLTDILMEAYSALLTMVPGPEACVPGMAEAFAKADKQMRKVMLSGMITEFGDSTRREAKTEVSGLGKLVLSGLM